MASLFKNNNGKLEKVTVNITDQPITDEELQRYREGRASPVVLVLR